MTRTRPELSAQVRALGVDRGDAVMLHASVRAVGPVLGGPDQIHEAVLAAVQPGGALMMYVGCPEGYEDVGGASPTREDEARLRAELPTFDFRHARAARDFGALAEIFRSSPGTVCSEHVGARMAARGDRAHWLVDAVPWDYGYGPGSPLARLVDAGGKVLLLGSSHDHVTLLHFAEHVADFEGKRLASYEAPVRSSDGQRTWRRCEEFYTGSRGVHPAWPREFFRTIVDDFIAKAAPSQCRRGRIGDASSVVLCARSLVAHAIPIMEARAATARA